MTKLKRKNSFRLRRIALIALVAFAVHAVLPYFAVYNSSLLQSSTQEDFTTLFGEKILLCTSEGLKWVSWDEINVDLGDEIGHQDTAEHFQCPICLLASYGLESAVPEAICASFILPSNLIYAFDSPKQHTLKKRLLLLGSFSRAPPSIA